MSGPLAGLRVLDLSFYLSGPFAGHVLADLGAHVIKVEPTAGGDPSRRGQGLEPGSLPNAQFIAIQRNKQSLALDLKQPAGREVLYDLCRQSDVLLENYRPGVTRRLGIDYERLQVVNPRLIHCTITGFGSDGPLAQKPAFDFIIQAISGALSMTRAADGSPTLMGVFMGDLAASCFGVNAILASVYERERTGRGRHIDISMLESLLYLAPSQTQDEFMVTAGYPRQRGGGAAAAGTGQIIETADGSHILVHCPFPKFQQSLREIVGAIDGYAELLDDVRFGTPEARVANIEEFWSLVRRAFKTRPRQAWVTLLEQADVPCAPVNSAGEALETPQLRARDMVATVPLHGLGGVPTLAPPFTFSDLPKPELQAPPLVGEHTDEILSGVLGYSAAQIAALRQAGITVQASA